MKLWLVELWKARVQYLRPYYACTKPQQTDYPINSRHVWSLPLMWTCWSTLILAILLLALTVEDIMDTGSALANLNLALYVNTPLMVFWWRFAVLMSEEDSHSRYYKSKFRFCPCSMCSHSLLRNGCVMTRSFKPGVQVTMVVQPLKHKCCRRRRVKFIVHNRDSRRVISLLLMLAGDVEINPGPSEYEDYVSSLPVSVHQYLQKEIDWDHGGVEEDLDYIAQHLTDWESKLVVPLRFTRHQVDILKEKHKHSDPILLRLAFLREWKNRANFDATYENLLKACCKTDATSVAKAICDVLRRRVDENPATAHASDTLSGQLESVVSSREMQSTGTQYRKLDSENENSTDSSAPIYVTLPQDTRKMHRALLKRETDKIRMKYSSFSQSFKTNFLEREESGEVNFDDLYSCAVDVFDFSNHEHLLQNRNCKQLLQELLLQQSYVNFDKLKHLIIMCGTKKDKEEAEKYIEEYKHYAKQRVFECDPGLISSEPVRDERVVFVSDELPGHDKIMFVLDKDHSFRIIDADDFKVTLCEMLGMSYHEMILVRFIPGSIIIVALIPKKYVFTLTNIPLYRGKVQALKQLDTLRIRLNKQEIISLNHLNLLDAVKFDEGTFVESERISVSPVDVNGTKCMALEYTACFCDESSADSGYVDYMERFLSGKHSNLPALKGVYYHPETDDTNRHYPVIVVERLKSLKDVYIDKEVDQVSVLFDIVSSVASFGSDHMKCKVVPDAVFVRDGSSDVQARFCPLYGHSYVSNQSQAMVPHTPIPLSQLQWMDELVKFIYFRGNVPDKSELPENHVLKKMFDQRWLSKDERFRPQKLKMLLEELHQLLETEKTWIGLVASFSDDLVDDEFQVHLILIGHTGVGKTSLRKHLKNEPIDMSECPTIVMEPEFLYRESVNLEAGNPFKTLNDALKCSGGKVFLTMWDTGGQPIFQDLLPCFARLKCMYGIVFRLPDLTDFESKPEIRPFDANGKYVTSPFTNQDIFYRNLAFVQAYSCSMKERFEQLPPQALSTADHPMVQYPAAVVVGTCKDMAVVHELNESTTVEAKKNLNFGIGDFVNKNNVSVYPVPDVASSYIHEVDNTASGMKHDKGINFLRDNISRCAQESNTKVHRSWKMFEMRLKRLTFTTHINLGVLPLIEAIAIGHECGVENPRSALMYFHEVGVFMWHHMSQRDSLKSFLVIDPKTLLEVLSKVFCFNPSSVLPELADLIERGLITVDLFRSLLRVKASNIDDSWFMAFLEEHHLSTKVVRPDRSVYYFLPSLLSIEPTYEDSLNHPLSADVSPLFIVPESGYIPTGMFTRLLTALAGVTYGSTKWRIPFDDRYLISVCRNQFEFVVNDSLHLILSEFSKFIRIDSASYNSAVVADDLYFHIASTLDVQLQRIVPRWIENKEFTITFLCKNKTCSTQSSHFVSGKDMIFQSGNFVTCSSGSKFQLHQSQEVWLQSFSHRDRSSDLFEKSLQDGYLNLSTASIMFVGTDHAGCTSAKHLVFQESVPTTLQPTQLVKHEKYFRAEGDPTLRKLQPDNYDQVLYYSLSFGEIKEGHCPTESPADVSPNSAPHRQTASATKTSPEEPSKQATTPTPTPTAVTQNSATQNVPTMSESLYQQSIDLERIIDECASMDDFKKFLIKYSNGKISIFHSFDCGSNFLQMREILKVFIKNVSLCTLVTNSSKGLHQNELGLLQEYESCALRGLVIGSHCDVLSSLTTENVLGSEFVIKNANEMIFAVNYLNPQKPDHVTAASIMDEQLSSLAVTKRFPFSWYLFGFRLLRAMTGGVDILNVSKDCMVIAERLEMDRPTVEAALEHLTEQNLVLYFRDILNDVVFSGINFFSQFFSHLYNTISQKRDPSEETWKLAIINESDLNDIVLNFKHTTQNMSLANYITLFMKLQIMAPSNNAYLLPCVLPNLGKSDINRMHFQESSLSAPVIIKCPSTGYEFMCMLVSFLLTWTNYDWQVLLDASGAPVTLYKNCIKFVVLSSRCVIVISFSGGNLKVTVEHPEQESLHLWKVGDIILKGLEMSKVILSCQKNFEFELSYQCPCEIPEPHTATYNRDRDCVTCDMTKAEVSPLHYEKWLHTGTMRLGSLSVSKVVKTLRPWSERWMNVAEILQVPSEVISKIRVITTGKQSEDSALYKVVEWWFKNSPNPEWTAILSVESMMFNGGTSHQVSADMPQFHRALRQNPVVGGRNQVILSGGANWTAVAANCLSASSMAESPRALVHHIFQWDGGGSVIELVGSFNQWQPIPVTNGNSNSGGVYVDLELPVGHHQYMFRVDGELRLDPSNTLPVVDGRNQVILSDFQFGDAGLQQPQGQGANFTLEYEPRDSDSDEEDSESDTESIASSVASSINAPGGEPTTKLYLHFPKEAKNHVKNHLVSRGYKDNIIRFNMFKNGTSAIVAMTPASIGETVILSLNGSLVTGQFRLTVKPYMKKKPDASNPDASKKKRNRRKKNNASAEPAVPTTPVPLYGTGLAPPVPPTGTCRVFFGSKLPPYTNEQHIKDHFRNFAASILSVELIRDKRTKEFKGFGFIVFRNAGSAWAAISALNHSNLLGISIRVSLDKSQENQRSQSNPTLLTSPVLPPHPPANQYGYQGQPHPLGPLLHGPPGHFGPQGQSHTQGPFQLPRPPGPRGQTYPLGPHGQPHPPGPHGQPHPPGPHGQPHPPGPHGQPHPPGPYGQPHPPGPYGQPHPPGPHGQPHPAGPHGQRHPQGQPPSHFDPQGQFHPKKPFQQPHPQGPLSQGYFVPPGQPLPPGPPGPYPAGPPVQPHPPGGQVSPTKPEASTNPEKLLSSDSVKVTHLPPGITKEMLWEHFKMAGEIKGMPSIHRTAKTTYAHVNFVEPSAAKFAAEHLNRSSIDGVSLTVKLQRKKKPPKAKQVPTEEKEFDPNNFEKVMKLEESQWNSLMLVKRGTTQFKEIMAPFKSNPYVMVTPLLEESRIKFTGKQDAVEDAFSFLKRSLSKEITIDGKPKREALVYLRPTLPDDLRQKYGVTIPDYQSTNPTITFNKPNEKAYEEVKALVSSLQLIEVPLSGEYRLDHLEQVRAEVRPAAVYICAPESVPRKSVVMCAFDMALLNSITPRVKQLFAVSTQQKNVMLK